MAQTVASSARTTSTEWSRIFSIRSIAFGSRPDAAASSAASELQKPIWVMRAPGRRAGLWRSSPVRARARGDARFRRVGAGSACGSRAGSGLRCQARDEDNEGPLKGPGFPEVGPNLEVEPCDLRIPVAGLVANSRFEAISAGGKVAVCGFALPPDVDPSAVKTHKPDAEPRLRG